MMNWKKVIVSPETTLRESIAIIDSSGLQVAIVIESGRLVGLLNDGDVRRAILQGYDLNTSTATVMNCNPITAHASTSANDLLSLMRHKVLHHIPLLDDNLQVVDLVTLDSLVGLIARPNWVVLMAGGIGSRLMPLTKNCPKPMLYVGDKPILENIIDSFVAQGFHNFFLSVNYLAEIIHEYFGDGSKFGINIRYLNENKKLGTGGALSILPDKPNESLIVMNGDLLTRVNFDQILNFHEEHRADATMAVRKYDFQVPYGVVNVDGTKIISIDEKPVHNFFVNAGIYVFSPEALNYMPNETSFDMPAFFEKLLLSGKKIKAYHIREDWVDVGRIEELERAKQEWRKTPI